MREKMLNVGVRLGSNVSRLMRHSLITAKANKKGYKHWESIVGYTIQELKDHLEKQFKDGMNWDNYGFYGWHIDHIKPLSLFNFKSTDDDEFQQAWALENLQPLWCTDNWSKNNKYVAGAI